MSINLGSHSHCLDSGQRTRTVLNALNKSFRYPSAEGIDPACLLVEANLEGCLPYHSIAYSTVVTASDFYLPDTAGNPLPRATQCSMDNMSWPVFMTGAQEFDALDGKQGLWPAEWGPLVLYCLATMTSVAWTLHKLIRICQHWTCGCSMALLSPFIMRIYKNSSPAPNLCRHASRLNIDQVQPAPTLLQPTPIHIIYTITSPPCLDDAARY